MLSMVLYYYSYSSWREPLTDVKVTVAAAVSVAFLAPLLSCPMKPEAKHCQTALPQYLQLLSYAGA